MSLLERARWTAFTAWSARGEHRLPFRPQPAVLELQSRRVRAIVRHAQRSVPFYRELLGERGVDWRDVRTADDLRRLPVISGQDLRHSPGRFRSDRFSEVDTLELRSTGTTGTPKRVTYDHRALFLALAGGMRQRHMLRAVVGRRAGYREMTIARRDSVALQIRDFLSTRLVRLPWVELRRATLDQRLPPQVAIDSLRRFQPHTVFGMGSHIGALFRWGSERGLDLPRPKAVIYGGDRMAAADRELLESGLGIAVTSIYQAVEALRIGFQCERGRGFHLSLDTVAVRVVNEHLDDVPPGEEGEILVSNLVNRATVLLNYRLGDRGRLETEPCPCGRTLPTLELLEARPSEAVLLPDGSSLHAGSLLVALQEVGALRQVQVEQEALRRFVIRAVPDGGARELEVGERLAQAVRQVLGGETDISVRVNFVTRIPPGPGGKVRSVISRCLEEARSDRSQP